MAVSLENARNNTLCMRAEFSGFAAHSRLHGTGKTGLCVALHWRETCFACAMKSAVSSKGRELSSHAKGVVSGNFH